MMTDINLLFQRIDAVSKTVSENCSSLSADQLNLKPSPEKWSIAQVLDHIIIINETYYPIFDALKNGSYKVHWMGKTKFFPKFFGNMILKSVQPSNKKKIKTFPVWQPSQSHLPADMVQRFLNNQGEFKKRMDEMKSFVEKGSVIHSPANRKIVYYLATALDIIVSHEERHLIQIIETKEMLKL